MKTNKYTIGMYKKEMEKEMDTSKILVGVRKDMKLSTWLKRKGYPSLGRMLDNERK